MLVFCFLQKDEKIMNNNNSTVSNKESLAAARHIYGDNKEINASGQEIIWQIQTLHETTASPDVLVGGFCSL